MDGDLFFLVFKVFFMVVRLSLLLMLGNIEIIFYEISKVLVGKGLLVFKFFILLSRLVVFLMNDGNFLVSGCK